MSIARDPNFDGELPEGAAPAVVDMRAVDPDDDLDRSLRPSRLDEFVAQDSVTDQLAVFIEAAKRRGEPLD
ncbi:MAG: hypothetical protein ACRDLO_13900, partial [Solirubrobacterales bacterium]